MSDPRIPPQIRALLAAAVCSLVLAAPFPAGAANLKGGTFAPSENAAKIPAFFVPNAGQARPDIRFQAAIAGRTVLFTSGQIIWMTPRAATPALSAPASGTRLDVSRQARTRGLSVGALSFEGAQPDPAVSGIDPIAAKISYLRGSNPARWRSGLPAYRGLLYRRLYPGIDLRLESAGGTIRSTFVVAPGVDPSLIRWRLRDRSAKARPEAAAGEPEAWQEGAGDRSSRRMARRAVHADGSIGLTFPRGYDPSRALLVDTRIFESTYLGGGGGDIAYAIAADASGKAYVTGSTLSTDFPTVGPIDADCGSDGNCDSAASDAFVAKIDPSQTGAESLVYATYLGGTGDDVGVGIAVDGAGVAYVAGIARAEFPTTAGAYQPAFGSAAGMGADGFLAKLGADGSSLLYATYFGGANGDGAWALAVDDSGNAWIAGQTYSADFPSTAGVLDESCGTDGACDAVSDAFLARLDTSKSGAASLIFSSYLGGSGDDQGFGIARGPGGVLAVTGRTASTDFPTESPFQEETGGGYDGFVSLFDAAGSGLLLSSYLGGTGYDDGYTILAEGDGKLAVIGTTSSDALGTTPDAVQRTFGGVYDAHFARIDPDLTGAAALFYATYLGGSNDDEGFGLALDAQGVAHVSGFTFSGDFPQRTCPLQPGSGGGYDAFFAMIRPSIPGPAGLSFASYLGGAGTDAAYGVALDGAGNDFVAGQTSSSDFPTADPADDTLGGATDAFVTAFAIVLPSPASISPRSGPAAGGTAVTIAGKDFQTGASLAIGGSDAGSAAVSGETQITGTTPALSPGTLNDVVVGNPDACGGTLPKAWMADFVDVPPSQLFHNAVEKIFRAGITTGCNAGSYCPDAAVTRDQMAIFLLRGKHGSSFAPPPATGTAFGDVAADAFGAPWIEQLLTEQITTGCGMGNYCPAAVVNRASMAVMLLRAKHGGSYQPPAAVGIFGDVPASDPFARWIEQLLHEGITGGCGGGDFCPNNMTTRGEMAAFLARTFSLP